MAFEPIHSITHCGRLHEFVQYGLAAFSEEIGTPEASERFQEQFITPEFEADTQSGWEMEAAYLDAVCAYQRDGFITGFKAAVQLLMSCMPDGAARGG